MPESRPEAEGSDGEATIDSWRNRACNLATGGQPTALARPGLAALAWRCRTDVAARDGCGARGGFLNRPPADRRGERGDCPGCASHPIRRLDSLSHGETLFSVAYTCQRQKGHGAEVGPVFAVHPPPVYPCIKMSPSLCLHPRLLQANSCHWLLLDLRFAE